MLGADDGYDKPGDVLGKADAEAGVGGLEGGRGKTGREGAWALEVVRDGGLEGRHCEVRRGLFPDRLKLMVFPFFFFFFDLFFHTRERRKSACGGLFARCWRLKEGSYL